MELENGENEPRRNIEPRNGPEPETVALPDALPIALVDESLPVGKSPHKSVRSAAMQGYQGACVCS